ncbi:MAG: hypothetical protein AB7V50_00760 [Vampirovibrionia bacterium]
MGHNNKEIDSSRMKDIRNSINTMIDCVNKMEKTRSYEYLRTIKPADIDRVISQMKALEEKLEHLNKQNNEKKQILKAIGKNRTLWVTKPANENDIKEVENINKHNVFKTKPKKSIINCKEIEKLFKKSCFSEKNSPDNNIKTKILAVKYNLANFF